jgi:hypothetical protein
VIENNSSTLLSVFPVPLYGGHDWPGCPVGLGLTARLAALTPGASPWPSHTQGKGQGKKGCHHPRHGPHNRSHDSAQDERRCGP